MPICVSASTYIMRRNVSAMTSSHCKSTTIKIKSPQNNEPIKEQSRTFFLIMIETRGKLNEREII